MSCESDLRVLLPETLSDEAAFALVEALYASSASDEDDLKLSFAACEIAGRAAPYRLVDNASRIR